MDQEIVNAYALAETARIAARVQEKAQELIKAAGPPPDLTEDEKAAMTAGVSAGFSATLLVLREEGLV